MKDSRALNAYMPRSISRIRPIRSKLMLPVPDTFATRPLNSSVVA